MDNSSLPSRRDRKKSPIWPWVLALVCFLGAAVAGAMFASSSLLDKPKETKPAIKKEQELLTAKDKATIMIMGVDERADDVGRSDTLMVAAIDPDLDKASLLSIPRDTRVRIKGHGYDKINAAFAYGGENLTHRTVEDFLGISVDYYIIINTHSFVKIIDALGGIDVDVEKRMYYEDPWDDDGGLLIDLRPGLQHMDGKTAVTYVRYRDEEGDIGRIKRQQKFMKACMDQIASPSILTKLPSILQEVSSSVKTNLSMRQLLEFAGTLKNAQKNGLTADMVPGRPLYIDEISYWIPDINQLRFTVADILGITVNSNMRSSFERAAREYENSIPSSATEVPAGDTSIGKATTSTSSSRKSEAASGRGSSSPEPPLRDSSAAKNDTRETGETRNDRGGSTPFLPQEEPRRPAVPSPAAGQESSPSPRPSATPSPEPSGGAESSVPTRGTGGKTQ